MPWYNKDLGDVRFDAYRSFTSAHRLWLKEDVKQSQNLSANLFDRTVAFGKSLIAPYVAAPLAYAA